MASAVQLTQTYELPIGDSLRKIYFQLSRNSLEAWEEPESALLKIKIADGEYETRDLERDEEDDAGVWFYQIEEADFDVFDEEAEYQCRIYATFASTRRSRFPTKGALVLKILEDWE